MAWSGFVVRSFGERTIQPKAGSAYQVDFDHVQRALIDPALAAAGIRGSTTETIFEAGTIREDMFQLLAQADIVIADISLHNANVFYELGVRHALRPKRTYLIRFAGDEVPFDIKTDRYLAYDRHDPAASVAALTAGLRAALDDREGRDSPIYQLLPELKPPRIRDLLRVPQDFKDELDSARAQQHPGHLALLAQEANTRPWGAEGLRLVARALAGLKAYGAARDAWEAVRTRLDRDLEADLRLATLHQRLRNLAASDAAVARAMSEHPDLLPGQRAEALSLQGSNAKERWVASWAALAPAELAAAALQSEHLRQAADAYAAGFAADLNHDHSGVNALAMARIRLELAQARPEAWEAAFDSDAEAQQALAALQEQVRDLGGAVQLSLLRAERAAPPGSNAARWVRCSLADAQLLRQEKPARVVAGLRRALEGAPPLFFDAVQRQLAMYARLGLFGEALAAARPVVDALEAAARAQTGGAAPGAGAPPRPDRVLLFTGHRIDAPGRTPPRFPASQEAAVRAALRQQIEQLRAGWPAGATVLGIAGGASGGDLLFHELCAELGLATALCLPMPVAPYLDASMRLDPAIDGQPGWIERFHAVRQRCEAAGTLHQLSASAELPRWLGRPADYNVWQRGNRWMLQWALVHGADRLTLLALWDGQDGDGPGGTRDLVDTASRAGATVRLVDPRPRPAAAGGGAHHSAAGT